MSRATDGNCRLPLRNGDADMGVDAGVDEIELRIDNAIDALRDERRPLDPRTAEEADLLDVIRLLRSTNDPAEPSPRFGQMLVASAVASSISPEGRPYEGRAYEGKPHEKSAAGAQDGVRWHEERGNPKKVGRHEKSAAGARNHKRRNWKVYVGFAAGLVAVLALLTTFDVLALSPRRNIAQAMARAVGKISFYHGILEKSYQTLDGEEQIIRRVEVWSSGEMYATETEDGTVTVNNGETKWQVRPQDRVVALLPVAPDPDRAGLDLRDEARRALEYPYRVVGAEAVANRDTTCIEISPPGGLPYHLWVDSETWLPLRLRTGMYNGIQTTYTYTQFETNAGVDQSIFEYRPPEGFTVDDNSQEQLITAPTEAIGIAGFMPLLPGVASKGRIMARPDYVRVLIPGDNGLTVVTQKVAEDGFEPISYAEIGEACCGPLEVMLGRLRWHQDGLEISVEGPAAVEISRLFCPDLVMPKSMPGLGVEPEVKIAVDMEVSMNDQMQVDGGHSPWRLDPRMVSVTFVNLEFAEETSALAANGEDLFSVQANDGTRAIVQVAAGPIAAVYLEKLVRQDSTGIWSVTGYDSR